MTSNTVPKPSNPVIDKPKNLSKTEKLMEDIRKMPLFRQLLPMESAIGWPIPVRKEGKIYVIFPFYGCTPQKGENSLFPPFATLTINWANQVPVEYVNLRFRNPAPDLNWEGQVGTFPHPAIAQITRGEYLEKRRELLAMYDEMLDNLLQNNPFTPAWNQRFSENLRLLIEPSLEPYYRVLGEKFFERFLVK